ncbi:hypothetical protein PEBR_00320 [Penicillium brasilianum]|uniref:Zn(2)-C6 fungal-type domain-containing protein n=1 Tax=Penicillium brasilianum TaxID=104259 RepID=A0A1S9S0T4_PENBI|nr:hypothetical protein PEBR_00320 [Penicillium brasilianum]
MQASATERPPSPLGSTPPPTRSKRAKYTAKACEYCHRRKIKCDGEFPCAACRCKDRECVKDYAPTQRDQLVKKRKHTQQAESSNTEDEEETSSTTKTTTALLLDRVSGIERQLQQLLASLGNHPKPGVSVDGEEHPQSLAEPAKPDKSADPPPSEVDTADPVFGPGDQLSYVGETSISRTLQQVEDSLHELGLPGKDHDNPAAIDPLSALLNEGPIVNSILPRKPLLQILSKHQLRPNKAEWGILLDLYCDDVHPLYPFLHLPSLRRSYTQIIDQDDLNITGTDYFSQVLICLALGRCTTSVRAETSEGTQSSGWAFYTAALEYMGEVFDPFRETSSGLPRLQVLTLIIIYLIRIDANERAQKVLSLTIVRAQHLGLHREVVLKSAPKFAAECSRRLWWCLYSLDRRVALDIGQPFLIQDINTDTKLPLLLSEEGLETLYHGSATSSPIAETHVSNETDDDCRSPIAYLISMTGYSKIVGKAWNELYQAHCMDRASDPALTGSFEDLLALWKDGLPPSLSCDEMSPHEHQPCDAPVSSSQMKNKFLLHIRMLWLRIILRKPLRSRSSPIAWIHNFDNESVCISLADRIISFYSRIFDKYRIYTFPFIQYLLGAASTILGLIIKVPVFRSRHTNSLVQAAQMMTTFCNRTWVSGKTLRSVKRFTDMMANVVNQNSLRTLRPQSTKNCDSMTLNGTLSVASGQSPMDGHDQNTSSLAGGMITRLTPTDNGRDSSYTDAERTIGPHHPTHAAEGDASYLHTLTSSSYDFLNVPNFVSGLDAFSSLAPDLERLVTSDYPFEKSVSDRNLLLGSGDIIYDEIAGALY